MESDFKQKLAADKKAEKNSRASTYGSAPTPRQADIPTGQLEELWAAVAKLASHLRVRRRPRAVRAGEPTRAVRQRLTPD